MANVTFDHVMKQFKGRGKEGLVAAVNDLSIEVKDKEFLVLVGPSGCGKTTALRLLAGLEEITAGNILIGDRVVNDVAPKDRDIAMVFQSYALYPHMSVYDNMAFGLKLRKTPKVDIERRVKEAADILDIGMLLQRKPKELSGGQRQRVALGRAIVREPQVFLFDEPLSNLDAKLRVQMRGELQALHKRLGTTSLYVTHDQVEAMTLAQRMIVMNAGRAEQIGAPLEVYAKPATTFVASFIGSPPMNLIPRDGKILGVRPEHLEPCAPGDASLTIDVDVIEPLGADTLAYGSAGEARAVVRLPAATAIPPGKLPLRFAKEHAHWFDAATGRRLEA